MLEVRVELWRFIPACYSHLLLHIYLLFQFKTPLTLFCSNTYTALTSSTFHRNMYVSQSSFVCLNISFDIHFLFFPPGFILYSFGRSGPLNKMAKAAVHSDLNCYVAQHCNNTPSVARQICRVCSYTF